MEKKATDMDREKRPLLRVSFLHHFFHDSGVGQFGKTTKLYETKDNLKNGCYDGEDKKVDRERYEMVLLDEQKRCDIIVEIVKKLGFDETKLQTGSDFLRKACALREYMYKPKETRKFDEYKKEMKKILYELLKNKDKPEAINVGNSIAISLAQSCNLLETMNEEEAEHITAEYRGLERDIYHELEPLFTSGTFDKTKL